MTSMLHTLPDQDPFDTQLQRAQLRQLTTSRAAATAFAEAYTGIPLPHL
jgi:p-hydroxybenzoate 3-monooxygenase